MLLTGSQLIDMPVMGLQTGKELARTSVAIVNPHDLSVVGYRVAGEHLDENPSFLRTADIREMGSLGLIVDSSDEFVVPDDIIVQKEIYDLGYALEGKQVIDDHKKKVGKVEDYVIDIDSFVIQQLVVKRPLLKSFNDDELLVHRTQIIEVNDHAIIIKSAAVKVKESEPNESPRYTNPFRQTAPQTESAHTDSKD